MQFDDDLQYDFTSDSSQAYGNNLARKGTKWCIFSGDSVRDGVIDGGDLSIVSNEASAYLAGYRQGDVTGDRIVDASDLMVVNNNVFRYVTAKRPSVSPTGEYYVQP